MKVMATVEDYTPEEYYISTTPIYVGYSLITGDKDKEVEEDLTDKIHSRLTYAFALPIDKKEAGAEVSRRVGAILNCINKNEKPYKKIPRELGLYLLKDDFVAMDIILHGRVGPTSKLYGHFLLDPFLNVYEVRDNKFVPLKLPPIKKPAFARIS